MNTILIKELLYQDYFLDIASDAFIKLQNQEEAAIYCQFLNYGGYTDWRLPTWDECCSSASNIYFRINSKFCWYSDIKRFTFNPHPSRKVIPVRDIID